MVRKLHAYRLFLIYEGWASFVLSMIFTVGMVYQITVAGLDPLQLVLVGTTLEVTAFLFEIPTGIVADVYSRRLSVIIGTVVMGLGFILEGSIPLFLTIVLAQVVWGLGWTFTSGATQAWLSDEIGEAAAGRAFLRASQVGQVASLGGILAGSVLGSLQVNLPIVLGGGLLVLLGLFLAAVMPETGFKPVPAAERDSWRSLFATFQSGLGLVRSRPALLNLLAIGFFFGLYSEGFDRLWTKHLLDRFTFPTWGDLQPVAWIGIINATGMILTTGATEIVRRRVDTDDPQQIARFMMTGTVFLILSLISFALVPAFGLALACFWSIYILRRVIAPLYTAWVNQRLDSRVRATVLSMSSQMDAIGQISGGPVLGLVGSLISVQAALTASGVLLSPAIAFLRRALNRPAAGEVAPASPVDFSYKPVEPNPETENV